MRREVTAEEFVVAVVFGPQATDEGFGVGRFALATGVAEAVAEASEGGEAEAGLDDALDDVGGLRGIIGVPGVGDGIGDAAELDDGEFAGELALRASMRRRSWEMVMGVPRDCQNQD